MTDDALLKAAMDNLRRAADTLAYLSRTRPRLAESVEALRGVGMDITLEGVPE